MGIERTEGLNRRFVRAFDHLGERMFPHAQALGTRLVLPGTFQAAVPVTPPPIRPTEIRRIELPLTLAITQGPAANSGRSGNAPASTGTDPARPNLAVRIIKALLIGQTNGKFSFGKTTAKAGGWLSAGVAFAFMAINGPVGLLGALPSAAVSTVLFLKGRSKAAKSANAAGGTAPAPSTRFPFLHVEQKINAMLRIAIYAGYGVDLLASGAAMTVKGLLFLKVATSVIGLTLIGVHLLLRRDAKKILTREAADAEKRAAENLANQSDAARAQGRREMHNMIESNKTLGQKVIDEAVSASRGPRKEWGPFLVLAREVDELLDKPAKRPTGTDLETLPVALDYARGLLGDGPFADGSTEADVQSAIMSLLTKIDPLLPKKD